MSISELTFIETKCVSGAADGGEGGSNGNLNDQSGQTSASSSQTASDCGSCAASILGATSGPQNWGSALSNAFSCGTCVNDLISTISNMDMSLNYEVDPYDFSTCFGD